MIKKSIDSILNSKLKKEYYFLIYFKGKIITLSGKFKKKY